MRSGLVLVAIGAALLLAPARAEVGRAQLAEGYAERVVGAGLLELPPAAASTIATPSKVRAGRRVGAVGLLDVATALPGALAARAAGPGVAAVLRALGGVLAPIILFATIGSIFFARLRRAPQAGGLGLSPATALTATGALLFSTSLLFAVRRAEATLLAACMLQLLLDEITIAPASRRWHVARVALLGATLTFAAPAYGGAALALGVLDVSRRAAAGRRLVAALAVAAAVLAALALGRWWDVRVGLPVEGSGARVHALYGLLLSPGRSLFVFSPLALAGVLAFPRLWARARLRAESLALACAAALVVIAGRADWHGDPAYGPTLVVPLLPLLVEPAALLLDGSGLRRLAFATAAVAGLVVQGLGLVVDPEAWPRVVAELRAATGAPGWFLDPAADIEFVPQLSPVVGQATLARLAYGHAPVPAPFLLVVGGDQAEVGTGPSATELAWTALTARVDRAGLRPNLALVAAPAGAARAQVGIAALGLLAGAVVLARARREAA